MAQQATGEGSPSVNPVGAGLALQSAGLSLLLAEARALATLLPGHWTPYPTEAETEADHDTLPL
ncbi:MAG: hypothetical protein B7Z31_01165 [Rhodobacterales bacterium 12-65-15]|nr:MAG: hypothetical protein B7Z31_01165 [Rhodobacterales bacterium 12-65-15]